MSSVDFFRSSFGFSLSPLFSCSVTILTTFTSLSSTLFCSLEVLGPGVTSISMGRVAVGRGRRVVHSWPGRADPVSARTSAFLFLNPVTPMAGRWPRASASWLYLATTMAVSRGASSV